jgi:hypothetical protein
MSELTQLLRSQYTTDGHIIAGVGEHTTTAGQTSSHLFGRLVQRIERSLSAEVRQRNRAGVDAYIAQIRAVNADLADAAAAALAETRAQGKPLTVHRVRELGADEISHTVQQQAAALMSRHGIRHVPLTQGGRVVSLVSERDLFARQRRSLRALGGALRSAPDLAEWTVGEGDEA